MAEINRRSFLTFAGLGAIGAVGLGARPWGLQYAGAAPLPTGTTLEAVAMPLGSSGYRKLGAGPGWPTVVRTELAEAKTGREDRRTALASFVQITDVHIIDAQSPMRFEFVDSFNGSAHRPQETMAAQGLTALVRQINAIASGPHTQRRFDAVVTTGDNTDNKEFAELDWFLTAMNGGTITPNTGAPDRYEGVQDSDVDMYWNPGSSVQDKYKQAGFPEIPGLLDAAIAPFTSPGLNTPWYCVFGNHDDTPIGTLPNGIPLLERMYTGSLKFMEPGSPEQVASVSSAAVSGNAELVLAALSSFTKPPRKVTPDLARSPFTKREFVAEHLKPENTGPGPVGHGFTPDAGETGIAYYSFEIAPGVVGIGMDSTNPVGLAEGSLGEAQLQWIEETLIAGSSRYYDTDGSPVSRQGTDTWFVLFSHHTSSMDALLPDPANPSERRVPGSEVVDLLHRFPNVLAWVNGHTHRNKVRPREGATPEQSFWEINTASHIDFPQLGRIIEVTDNVDGTVSLFTTLFEADSPYSVDYTDLSPVGLASLYREFAFNDASPSSTRSGTAEDQNVELVLASGR
ncbi:TIGR03767 family metallophosphoesterase [Rhodococcus spongiicola]|uniref:TIGR03767 family metallophosphoesterase n=1 Tax=Rhodococcus spongiicola TaxID=2487352 RepID=A0A3S3BMF9_9NOCA|nr:TIGR03767 family metallophosphoesterase [Rhodococcus spongiicola]RVW04708.1 TIGR03767 family metallophosphoesterase [Rhodococcus spongiicola]